MVGEMLLLMVGVVLIMSKYSTHVLAGVKRVLSPTGDIYMAILDMLELLK